MNQNGLTPLREPNPVTDEDRIIKYICSKQGEVVLSEEQQKMLERYSFIDDQIRDNKLDKEIVEELKKKYGIEKTQAYIDIRATRYVFNSQRMIDKNTELYQLNQASIQVLRLAIESKDVGKMIRAIEARAKVLELIPDEEKGGGNMQNNFFVIMNQGKQQGAFKLDLNTVDKLQPEQIAELQEVLETNAIDATFEILEDA